jgi:hypothetical protein
MPYLFPHEDAFLVAVGGLVVGLLLLRIRLSRRRRPSSADVPRERSRI